MEPPVTRRILSKFCPDFSPGFELSAGPAAVGRGQLQVCIGWGMGIVNRNLKHLKQPQTIDSTNASSGETGNFFHVRFAQTGTILSERDMWSFESFFVVVLT